MAGVYNFVIDQGSTKRVSLKYQRRSGFDSEGQQLFEAYNLTGCTARLQVRQKTNTPVILDLSSSAGEIQIQAGGEQGRVDVVFSAQHTSALEVSQAIYDLRLTFPSGDVVRLVQGKIEVSPSVTEG